MIVNKETLTDNKPIANETKTTEKKRKKKRKQTKLFPLIMLIISSISLVICIRLIYTEINKELKIKNMEENMQTFVKPSVPEQVISETDRINTQAQSNEEETIPDENTCTFDWDGIFVQSEYVTGWIQIPGIERLNYAVVKHPDDNQFFLTHDWTGAPQNAGSIFMNKHNASDFTDMNTILYGHRMKDGSMFGSLKYYKDQEFMDENHYLYIYTPDGGKLTYDIICYSSVIDGSDAYMRHFESPDERMAYYDMLLANAITKRDTELDRFDTTIMLSTCNTTGYYDRLVILGKLIAVDLNGQPENQETD